MTNYSEIVNCLRNADEPLQAREISDRTGIRGPTVYRHLKKMREKGKVFADEDLTSERSVIYQLRK